MTNRSEVTPPINLEITMKTTAKKMLIRALAVAALAAGAIGTANAGYWTYDVYGNSVYVRTCYNEFVRTDPFNPYVGYWTQVCN